MNPSRKEAKLTISKLFFVRRVGCYFMKLSSKILYVYFFI